MKDLARVLYNISDIHSHILNDGGEFLFSTEESVLSDFFSSERSALWLNLKNEVNAGKEGNALHFQSSNQQNFILYKNKGKGLLWGPFLTSPPDSFFFDELQLYYSGKKVPFREIVNYYRSLHLLENRKISGISRLIISLSESGLSPGGIIHLDSREDRRPPLHEYLSRTIEKRSEVSLISERYDLESRFMEAVSRGNKEEAMELIKKSGEIMALADRVKGNPLRSIRDISITLNTLLRVAAKQGGLHPRNLHSISEKYAILIESSKTMNGILNLHAAMIGEYADAVKDRGTVNFSRLVRRAARYISANLDEDLTLASLSAELSVNPSYLSRLFKKETGDTFSAYVNKQRVHEAAYLLANTSLSISDISAQTGFSDNAYFCRVFRKIKGSPPTEYRRREG